MRSEQTAQYTNDAAANIPEDQLAAKASDQFPPTTMMRGVAAIERSYPCLFRSREKLNTRKQKVSALEIAAMKASVRSEYLPDTNSPTSANNKRKSDKQPTNRGR